MITEEIEKEHIDHKDGEPVDYDYITDGIYLGTNQCCQLGLVDVLKKEGVTIDISLEETRLDSPFGIESYTWIPVVDTFSPSLDQFDIGVSVLLETTKQKRKIYIHCQNGHGRSTTLLIAYLIKKGHTSEDAEKLIKEKRPEIHLSPAQKEGVKKYIDHTAE